MKEWASSFWNWLDLLRILTQIWFIVMSIMGEEYDIMMLNSLTIMTLCSWISFLQYLRFFEQERILIAYILASVNAMIPFMLIIVIMLTAFTLTYF
jgi:hypothetical protein